MSAALADVGDSYALPLIWRDAATRALAPRRNETLLTYSRGAATVWHAGLDRQVSDRLRLLLRLQPGWDGHGGRPLSPSIAGFAYGILQALLRPGVPAPVLMPLSHGGLQIEWHRNGWDIEIEVPGPNELRFWAMDVANGMEHHLVLGADVGPLLKFIDQIRD